LASRPLALASKTRRPVKPTSTSDLASARKIKLIASATVIYCLVLATAALRMSAASATTPPGPVTNLHYTANSNFDGSGKYSPGTYGFNLADVESPSQLGLLSPGVKALVWLGLCNGADSTFDSTVQPYIGNASVYGFYVMDEPDPTGLYQTKCTSANLKAESDWIHQHDPGTKTFIILMNLSSSKTPSFTGSYTPSNSDIDLFGIDPYPCRSELSGCNYSMIQSYVSAAESFGIPEAQIVPVYQGFGGGNWVDDGGGSYLLPTAYEASKILSSWRGLVPNPPFDYVYSWGSQNSDQSVNSSSALELLFASQNTSPTSSTPTPPSTPALNTTHNAVSKISATTSSPVTKKTTIGSSTKASASPSSNASQVQSAGSGTASAALAFKAASAPAPLKPWWPYLAVAGVAVMGSAIAAFHRLRR
jgi:hypothetical protein